MIRSAPLKFAPPIDPAESKALLDDVIDQRHRWERLFEVLTTPGHAGIGATDHDVVLEDGPARLLRMRLDRSAEPSGPPVLFVTAPVSRYFVLDLAPGRSFVAHVAAAGFDVYLLDFGEPDSGMRFADLDYYVNGVLHRAVRQVIALSESERTSVVGYCLGGTLSLLYAALHPSSIASLALLTTSVDADVKGGIPWVAHCMGMAGESYDNPRLVPAEEVKSWFEMLAPGSNSVAGRSADLWERLAQPVEKLRDVRTMASWVDDAVPASGRLLAELFAQFGPGKNGLMRGTAEINGRPIRFDAVTMPVLSVSAERDTIAPADGVDAIAQLIPHARVIRLPGGHVGVVAGRTALALWDTTVEFLRDAERADHGSGS
mgnify:CR=1 FL=1|jgi:polyhydroxyalkanoate synthase